MTIALALIAVITLMCFPLFHVNATTAGFGYLVGVLLIAAAWGLLESTVASVVAMLSLNYFFLPPVGKFTIADSQNWVALFAFLATSITASELSERAKRRARDAVDREREIERLYTLSRAILLTDTKQPVAKQIAHQIAHIFEFPAVALFEGSSGETHRGGPEDLPDIAGSLRDSAIQGNRPRDDSRGLIITPIQLGGEPIGSLALRGARLSNTALQALSNLVAIGLERERDQEAANRAEAVRQSEAFKSTLLDAVAHEFKTPLTSIKAATSSLLSDFIQGSEEQRELITIVDEEAERLARLVTEAIQTARLEGGKLHLSRDLHSASSLIAAALHPMKPMTNGREVQTRIGGDLPHVNVDPELIQLAIRHLVDNALKYSSPTTPITISARAAESNLI
ncbi:MAG: sensor histidine kinase, partial [Terriglobia bacterium]